MPTIDKNDFSCSYMNNKLMAGTLDGERMKILHFFILFERFLSHALEHNIYSQAENYHLTKENVVL